MKTFDADGSYFALTLGANRQGSPFWSMQSHWIGESDRTPHWEIRTASLVRPDRMTELWTSIGQGWVSVHNDASLAIYLRIGGERPCREVGSGNSPAMGYCSHRVRA